ncbi:MAG: low molecular weight phosphatase family protein [Actinomycetota bacterium]|nr:low molecular weight phosphatase family protein [Actinomycetota bacterium]
MSFDVLYVCTGNVCRSPMAELLMRGWMRPDVDATVGSAGVKALVGYGIDRSSASALGQLGIDPSKHRARQFEYWMAENSHLILTATRNQRDIVMTAAPRTMRRTFTMKEFVRLSGPLPGAGPDDVVAAAAARRGRVPSVTPEEDNVRDPYRGAIAQAKTIAEEITETVYSTLDVLGFAAERWAHPTVARTGRGERPAPY